MYHNPNGTSSHFSNQNSSWNFPIESPPRNVERMRAAALKEETVQSCCVLVPLVWLPGILFIQSWSHQMCFTGWPFRLFLRSCWHQNRRCVLEYVAHTKMQSLFLCQPNLGRTLNDHIDHPVTKAYQLTRMLELASKAALSANLQ